MSRPAAWLALYPPGHCSHPAQVEAVLKTSGKADKTLIPSVSTYRDLFGSGSFRVAMKLDYDRVGPFTTRNF